MGDYADGTRYWPPGFRTSQDLAEMADEARKQDKERGIAPGGVEVISQSKTQVGPVAVTFTVGRIKPK